MRRSCILCVLALLACSTQPPKAPPKAPPEAPAAPKAAPDAAPDVTAAAPEPGPPAGPELAETLDLVAGAHRWHMYDDAGLILGFAGEGFRKYTQEYKRPFGELETIDGEKGRAVTRNTLTLRVSWEKAVTLRLHLHGGGARGQTLRFDVNGRKLATRKIADGWSYVDVAVPEALARKGDNEIRIRASRRGPKAWFYVRSLHVMGQTPVPEASPLPSSPTLPAQERPALGAVPRVAMYVEVPKATWFTAQMRPGGASGAKGVVRVVQRDGTSEVLWEREVGKVEEVKVDLGRYAGQLVRLELEARGGLRVESPSLRLERLEARPKPKPVRHVILWVVDALRSDRLSLYGDTRVETPNMTAWGKHAIVYRRNQAAAPSSPPSHGSIQTGMIPRVHGVTGDKGKLKPGTPMLSTQARDAGIEAAYFGNNAFGMRRLKKAGRWSAFHEPNFEGKGIDCKAIVEGSLAFAKKSHEAKKRFFISALPFEPHTPYRYHAKTSPKYHEGGWGPPVGKSVDGYKLGAITSGKTKLSKASWSQLRALYDGEIEHMDGCLGQLWKGLEKLGILEETALVITSDHGEGMFEHKRMGHAYGHYAELSNVPFVVYLPGRVKTGPWNVEAATSNIDIVPTVLELLGVEPKPQVQGESVLGLALRPGEGFARTVSMEYGKSFALRSRQYKLMVGYGGKEQLFDQQADPTEQRDILGKDHFATRYMRDMVGGFLAHRSQWKAKDWGSWSDPRPGFVEATRAAK